MSVREVVVVIAVASLMGLFGCTGSKETEDRPRRAVSQNDVVTLSGPELEGEEESVATVQIYPGEREGAMPVLSMSSGDRMTLRFDVVADRGRPLSVYFYHADRNWRRDLMPAEFLGSFHRDDLLNYRQSAGTETTYYHYRYQFPNESIQFRVSGNYILRVTEQGMEDEVLFERPFFVAEQSIPAELTAEYVLSGGSAFTSTQPYLLFTPGGSGASNPYDYSACFVRNGRIQDARCSTRPSLAEAPALQFYLPPQLAFQAEAADYFLDLGALQVGQQIERVDFTQSPISVLLEPDYAKFGGTGLNPLQYGQPVVQAAVRDRSNPEVGAEYVEVHFSLVPPDEIPYAQDVYVIGAFNNWTPDSSSHMTWIGSEGRYEGSVFMKQGRYEYTYWSRDRRLRDGMNEAPPRPENAYQALIYYDDIRVGTQRLLAVSGVAAR